MYSIYNRYSRCFLHGLNKYACFGIIREPCQFTTSCISFTAVSNYCYQVSNVNYLGCSVLTQDTCGYDPLNYNCYSLIGTPPCNLLGLSKVGCALNTQCSRNDDDNVCLAKQLSYTNQCKLTKYSCIASDVCSFQNNTCVRKQCDHLTLCQGIINGITCFKNSANVCQGATKCEDIVLLNKDQKCEDFYFFAAACITTTIGCASQSNLALICGFNQSNCGTQCINKNGVCRAPVCSDFNQAQCLQQDSCLFQNNVCQQIEACTQVTDLDLCSSVTVRNLQCSWQEYKWLDTTMYCTAIWCDLFGSSYTLCNGNEINGKTCLLDQFYQCKSCDLISDQATCNNSNNACQFVNGTCQSIFCSSFNTESTCGQISRCYWSSQDNVCRKLCVQNIRVEQCDALQYECHWNPYTSTCKQGAEQVPDLSVKIIQYAFCNIMINNQMESQSDFKRTQYKKHHTQCIIYTLFNYLHSARTINLLLIQIQIYYQIMNYELFHLLITTSKSINLQKLSLIIKLIQIYIKLSYIFQITINRIIKLKQIILLTMTFGICPLT